MRARRRWLGVALLIIGLVVAGCGRQPAGTTSGAVRLTGAGASFPYPLYSRWISDYHTEEAQVQVSYESIGSGGGMQRLKDRTVDFGASDAPLSDAEAKAMPASVVHIPTVAGAVVVVYNLPEVAQPLKLDGPTLAGIYLGQISKWSDAKLAALNPGVKLPSTAIAVNHRSDGSGTSYLFTNYLAAVSPEWASKVGAGKSVNWPAGLGAKGNEGVTGNVKQTAGAIGYVELAYAQQNKLSYAQLKNAAGEFITATVAATTAAAAGAAERMKQEVRTSIINSPAPDAYPIAGFTYILIYQEQPDGTKGAALARFLQWAISKGQSEAASLGYAPLPAAVAELDRAALAGLTYQGKPLISEQGK